MGGWGERGKDSGAAPQEKGKLRGKTEGRKRFSQGGWKREKYGEISQHYCTCYIL